MYKLTVVFKFVVVLVVLFLIDCSIVESHSGGTDSDGCHTQKSTGDYHCHTPKKVFLTPETIPSTPDISSSTPRKILSTTNIISSTPKTSSLTSEVIQQSSSESNLLKVITASGIVIYVVKKLKGNK